MMENIPRPVLWGVGGLVGVLVLLKLVRPAPAPNRGDALLGATLSSMQMAAASNIEALAITSQRDVALAGEYTARYGIANQVMAAREGMALDFMSQRGARQTSITMQEVEHKTIRKIADQNYTLNRRDQNNARRAADQIFKLASAQSMRNFILDKKQQAQDFFLAKKFTPQMFELQLRQLAMDAQQQRYDYDIQTRRLDIMQFMGMQSAQGGYMGNQGNVFQQPGGQPTTAGALGGAALGAAAGMATCAATGWFTFGASCIPAMAAGAAAGGGGGMS